MKTVRSKGTLIAATALAAVVGLASPAMAVASATTVTATPQSTTTGAPVELEATVTCPADPTGGLGVTFFDGPDLLATVPVTADGRAHYTATFNTTGTHTITAAYNGNGACDASNNTTTVNVTAAPTPPGPPPGQCLFLCDGLINISSGNTTNNSNNSNINSNNNINSNINSNNNINRDNAHPPRRHEQKHRTQRHSS